MYTVFFEGMWTTFSISTLSIFKMGREKGGRSVIPTFLSFVYGKYTPFTGCNF